MPTSISGGFGGGHRALQIGGRCISHVERAGPRSDCISLRLGAIIRFLLQFLMPQTVLIIPCSQIYQSIRYKCRPKKFVLCCYTKMHHHTKGDTMLHTDPQIVAKQITSVSAIWESTASLPDPPLPLILLSDKEYQNLNEGDTVAADVLSEEKIASRMVSHTEWTRPYISDNLWNAFYIARAFSFRLHIIVGKALKMPKGKRVLWRDDLGIRQYFDTFWEEGEYSAWLNVPFHGVRFARDQLEQKVLEECRKVLDIPSEGEMLSEKIRVGFATD